MKKKSPNPQIPSVIEEAVQRMKRLEGEFGKILNAPPALPHVIRLEGIKSGFDVWLQVALMLIFSGGLLIGMAIPNICKSFL